MEFEIFWEAFMNFFVDFDHTLYNTPLLTRDMLNTLATYISQKSNDNFEHILNTLTQKFKRGTTNIYDIYQLIEYFSQNQYYYDIAEATSLVNQVIFHGKKYLFDDAICFLQNLKEQGHKVYILSYNEKEVYFQTVKIAGSGLLKFVDGVFPIITQKGDLPFDFSKCIFIDDKPKDLISLYQKKPYAIFRIRRPHDTYSNLETNLPIPEFSSLNELKKILPKDEIKK